MRIETLAEGALAKAKAGHALTGVRIETPTGGSISRPGLVTPSRACGSKRVDAFFYLYGRDVTPSRACGSKRVDLVSMLGSLRHALTGVRIET